MSLKLFINNCISGGYHIGCFDGKGNLVECTRDKNEFPRIESSVSVKLNDNVEPTWSEVDKAIDEFFIKLNLSPQDDIPYKEEVTNGSVELLTKHSFGKNAYDLKQALREAVDILTKQGRHVTLK